MALVSVLASTLGPSVKVGAVLSLSAIHFFSVSVKPVLQAVHSSTSLVPLGGTVYRRTVFTGIRGGAILHTGSTVLSGRSHELKATLTALTRDYTAAAAGGASFRGTVFTGISSGATAAGGIRGSIGTPYKYNHCSNECGCYERSRESYMFRIYMYI